MTTPTDTYTRPQDELRTPTMTIPTDTATTPLYERPQDELRCEGGAGDHEQTAGALADVLDAAGSWDWTDGSDHSPSDRFAVVEHGGEWRLVYRGTEPDEAEVYPSRATARAALDEAVREYRGCEDAAMTRYYADDGNARIEIDTDTAAEATQEYVDGGDWDTSEGTIWIDVRTALADDVDAEGDDTDDAEWSWHTIAVEQDEPLCDDDRAEHDWQNPVEIVGGIAENPGVWGHGGGVTISECCVHCGCRRLTDTWAQDSSGRQGLMSVGYDEGYYCDALAERAQEASDDLTAEAQDDGEY